jgi:oligo-1,6-glucosidase
MNTKAWWKEAVIYQIYPRSFMDSNGDGIGDLKGITSRLDYLKDLGVDVIWLSPVYKSPNRDNGYDISDYQDIMDEFGTMADFDELLEQAHKRGLKILMDLVVNHTSSDHKWFVESRKSKDNPYRDYYIWREGRNGKEPNNWGSCFGGPAWEFDKQTGMYYLHCFAVQQPDLNWENDKVRAEVFNMMTWWCEKGIDGFRMDVISMISKVPGFPDGRVTEGLYGDLTPLVCNGPRVHEYLQEMNKKVLSKFDIMTVGEAAGVTIDEAKKYANAGNTELSMVFQFEHTGIGGEKYGKWTTKRYELKDLRRVLTQWETELEGKAWNSVYFGNHDQPRAVSRFGDDGPAWRVSSAKLLATCEFMLQGTPYIYQGEELGMTNVYFDKLEDYRDIEVFGAFNDYVKQGLIAEKEMMACFGARSRDNARTPMQWDSSPQAGFTSGTPWIRVNPNYTEINAAAQVKDPLSVYSYYKKLIALRGQYPVIVYGKYSLMESAADGDDSAVWAFTREWEGQKLLVLCNFSSAQTPCGSCLAGQNMGKSRLLIGNYEEARSPQTKVPDTLRPWEAAVYLL